MLILMEGIVMCFLLLITCVIGIANGPVGLVVLYENDVQDRVVELGYTTKEKIRKSLIVSSIAMFAPVLFLVPFMVYYINDAIGFWSGFWQMTIILWIMGLFDRVFIDWYWVGHTKAWVIPETEDLQPYIPIKVVIKKWLFTIVGFPIIAAIIAGTVALMGLFGFSGCEEPMDAKPVIYLYPEEETQVSVKLDYNGQITTTYPTYENGWNVIAKPDGTLQFPETGKEYYCLFWEGIPNVEYDMTSGFVIPGNETERFLEETLATLGLTEREANEFIIYWLPQMEGNAYNLISFQDTVYTENAKLEIYPQPDGVLRVFMAWKGLDAPVEVEAQTLKGFERNGFTVVEWGGAEIE